MGTKGIWHRGDGEAYRRNYPFGERRKPEPAPPTVESLSVQIAGLQAQIAERDNRIADLIRVTAAQARTLAGKARLWTEDERENYRRTRAARLAREAREAAEGGNER